MTRSYVVLCLQFPPLSLRGNLTHDCSAAFDLFLSVSQCILAHVIRLSLAMRPFFSPTSQHTSYPRTAMLRPTVFYFPFPSKRTVCQYQRECRDKHCRVRKSPLLSCVVFDFGLLLSRMHADRLDRKVHCRSSRLNQANCNLF